MMLTNELNVVQLFCEIDDFASVYEQKLSHYLLSSGTNSKHSFNKPSLSLSEMMTIEIRYHLSGAKCLEYFYVQQGSLHSYFPSAPSYNRFVELKPRMLLALICYLHCVRLGKLMGLYYAGSTALKVCHNRRINQNRVFSSSAKRGQTSTG